MTKIVWVLDDGRSGNTNQAIALAEALAYPYEIKKISYNIFQYLPSLLLVKYPIHLTHEAKDGITKKPAPAIIISAGRKTATIALYLKCQNEQIKLLQIMRPAYYSKQFAAIIVPTHDKYFKANNVIEITGALNNVTTKSKEAESEFLAHYPDLSKFIGVFIGGNAKNFVMNEVDATALAESLDKLANVYQLALFITFSRRTPVIVKKIIKEKFKSAIIYDPVDGGYNPYFGLIALAKCLVVTCDSISMLSEAATSGKILFIFKPDNFKSRKHLFFVNILLENDIAKMLNDDIDQLKKYYYKPLREIERIKAAVKNLLI